MENEEYLVLNDLRGYLTDVMTLIDSRLSELSGQPTSVEIHDFQRPLFDTQKVVEPHLLE